MKGKKENEKLTGFEKSVTLWKAAGIIEERVQLAVESDGNEDDKDLKW